MFTNSEIGAVLYNINNAIATHVASLDSVIVASKFNVKIDARNIDDEYIIVSKDDPFNEFAKQFLDVESAVTAVADYVFYSAFISEDIANLVEISLDN